MMARTGSEVIQCVPELGTSAAGGSLSSLVTGPPLPRKDLRRIILVTMIIRIIND